MKKIGKGFAATALALAIGLAGQGVAHAEGDDTMETRWECVEKNGEPHCRDTCKAENGEWQPGADDSYGKGWTIGNCIVAKKDPRPLA